MYVNIVFFNADRTEFLVLGTYKTQLEATSDHARLRGLYVGAVAVEDAVIKGRST
jgi:hypothetical protein